MIPIPAPATFGPTGRLTASLPSGTPASSQFLSKALWDLKGLHPRIGREDVRFRAVRSGCVRPPAGACDEYARKFELPNGLDDVLVSVTCMR